MIGEYLSKSERMACMKAGALSYCGLLDAELGPLPNVKEAGAVDVAKNSADAAKTLWILTTLGAGIPLGVFGHVMGRRIAGKRLREEELKEKIKLYQSATDELAAGLQEGNS